MNKYPYLLMWKDIHSTLHFLKGYKSIMYTLIFVVNTHNMEGDKLTS